MVKPVFNKELVKRVSEASTKLLQEKRQQKPRDYKLEPLSDYERRQVMDEYLLRKKSGESTEKLEIMLNMKPNKKDTTKKIKEAIKDIKTTSNKRKIKDTIRDVEASVKPKTKSKAKKLSSTYNILDTIHTLKKPKKEVKETVMDTMKEVEHLLKTPKSKLKKLVKADEMHIKYHPSKMDKEELKMDKDILLQPYKYKNMIVIDQIANSLKNPEFEAIKKKKIIDSYSYDIIKKFNEKYPELMLKLFKTDTAIENILKKKADRLEKNKLSDIKKITRLKKYAEKAKALRQEKKVDKTKHLTMLTPEQLKRYKSVRLYVKKNKPTITDEQDINFIVKEIIYKDIKRMSKKILDDTLIELDISE